MSLCVYIDQAGAVVPTGQPVNECSGYVLVSGAEHGVYQVVQDVFAFPTATQALGWFAGTFTLIVFLYLASRMAGTVANVFNPRHN